MTRQQWVLGIDGGGTKTDAILVARDGTLGTGESAGPANLNTVGLDRAAQIIFELAQKCCENVSSGPDDLYAVGIGLAGAGRDIDRAELHRHLLQLSQKEHFPLTSVVVETDWRIALEAAFASGPGVVLLAGTGSIACGKGADGKLFRAGGWGRMLGDEGSGFAISRDAVNAALRAHDGRSPQTMLLEFALQHFAVSSVEELIHKLYHEHADVASFVPKVLQAETKGDSVAHGILSRAADELIDLIRALITKIQPGGKVSIALMGGLLEKENVYSKMTREKLVSTFSPVVIQKPKFPAVYGAAILAFQPFRFPL